MERAGDQMASGMNWDKVRRQKQLQHPPENTKPKKSLHAQYGRFGRCLRSLDNGKRCPRMLSGRGRVLCDMHLKEEALIT